MPTHPRTEVNAALRGPTKHKQALMVIGPSNCGKSFLLDPLELIFSVFRKPPSGPGSSKLNGIQKKECVIWNEWDLDDTVMNTDDFLNWLEGRPFRIGAPKTITAEDPEHSPKNQPAFFSGGRELRIKVDVGGRETMINSRISYLRLHKPFIDSKKVNGVVPAQDSLRQIDPCPRCWARMVCAP
jgi:hypothetical protein